MHRLSRSWRASIIALTKYICIGCLMWRKYLPLAREHSPRARILYSVADLHHLRVARQAEIEERPKLMTVGRGVQRFRDIFFAVPAFDKRQSGNDERRILWLDFVQPNSPGYLEVAGHHSSLCLLIRWSQTIREVVTRFRYLDGRRQMRQSDFSASRILLSSSKKRLTNLMSAFSCSASTSLL
jgi:hypothetical protein